MSRFDEKRHHSFDFGKVQSQYMVTMTTRKPLCSNSQFYKVAYICMIKVAKFGED